MKNKELFERTVNVLVNAYLNNTLKNSDCAACAVGNLILASNGTKPIIDENGDLEWDFSVQFGHEGVSWYGVVHHNEKPNKSLDDTNKTGYTWSQLTLIENSFERPKGRTFLESKEERMYLSLMSVIDCLMNIHEANEIEVLQAKSLFIKETA